MFSRRVIAAPFFVHRRRVRNEHPKRRARIGTGEWPIANAK